MKIILKEDIHGLGYKDDVVVTAVTTSFPRARLLSPTLQL